MKKCMLLLLAVGLAACSTRPSSQTGSGGGYYKVGQPYQIKGAWYYPAEDYSYDETGIASWYGADFHGGRTANGEIYNKDELTAAHKTLPMPSLARVTNLDNGKSIVVRINDRGPFSGARLIDMSQRAAQLLGFEKQGTAKVRIQVLADESKAIADAMRQYGGTQTASAAPTPQAAPVTAVEKEAVHKVFMETKPVAEALQLPVTSTNNLYIQAGAFTVQDNAVHLQQKLASYGSTAITHATVGGKTFYRVRIGPIKDIPTADALLSKVGKAGVSGGRIVVD